MLPLLAVLQGIMRNVKLHKTKTETQENDKNKEEKKKAERPSVRRKVKRQKHEPHIHWDRLCLLVFTVVNVPLLAWNWKHLKQKYLEYMEPEYEFKTFSFDHLSALAQREMNMKKYAYNYSTTHIDKRANLSRQEFTDVYDGAWPVIITDVVPKWGAYHWSKQFLLKYYGKDRITMKAVDGRLDNAESLALPLELYFKHAHEGTFRRWTYVEDELFIPTRPQLRRDVGECEYLKEDYFQLFPEEVRPWNAMLLWGTPHSRSSLHIDPYNWTGTNAVIKGRKQWKLIPPGQDHLLYVKEGKMSGFPLECYKYNSPVDLYDLDLNTYPLVSQLVTIDVDQLPGELLIIPPGWFHQAYNPEETLAVSSQVMNSVNYRVVLEEILKAGNVPRTGWNPSLPYNSPQEQVQEVMSRLPKQLLKRGQAVTDDMQDQIQNGMKKKPRQQKRKWKKSSTWSQWSSDTSSG